MVNFEQYYSVNCTLQHVIVNANFDQLIALCSNHGDCFILKLRSKNDDRKRN